MNWYKESRSKLHPDNYPSVNRDGLIHFLSVFGFDENGEPEKQPQLTPEEEAERKRQNDRFHELDREHLPA